MGHREQQQQVCLSQQRERRAGGCNFSFPRSLQQCQSGLGSLQQTRDRWAAVSARPCRKSISTFVSLQSSGFVC